MLNRLNGISSVPGRPTTLHFAAAANSFFPILVFNDLLRGPEPGSMALIPAGVNASGYSLPAALARIAQAARNRKTSFRRRLSIWLCATARRDSPFSTSKDTSTTTSQRRSPLASLAEAFSFQKSLPTRSAVHRQLGAVVGKNLDRRGDATDRDRPAR